MGQVVDVQRAQHLFLAFVGLLFTLAGLIIVIVGRLPQAVRLCPFLPFLPFLPFHRPLPLPPFLGAGREGLPPASSAPALGQSLT